MCTLFFGEELKVDDPKTKTVTGMKKKLEFSKMYTFEDWASFLFEQKVDKEVCSGDLCSEYRGYSAKTRTGRTC